MEYYNLRCPVCEKDFDKDSDIVVCPECGAPHHRECYEIEMKCHFDSQHKDGFDYKAEIQSKKAETDTEKVFCRMCGSEIEKDSKFCNQCGSATENYAPHDRHSEETESREGTPYTPPQGERKDETPFTSFAFDPMGGLKAEDEIGEGVTVGECAKFVKNNTPFYSRLFYQMHKTGRNRFSFVGFLFSGGWMLYRKMYKLGAVITALLAVFIIAQLYINTFYSNLMIQLEQAAYSGTWFAQPDSTVTMQSFIAGLDKEDIIVLAISYLAGVGQIALRVLCGIFGNRWYKKHCIKKITQIKSEADSKETADAQLQTKGGVNNALAMSLVFSYFLLSVLPYFF